MTYDEFLVEVSDSWRDWPGMRKGQRAWNTLVLVRPDLAQEIRRTEVDPFYFDARLDAFYAWVKERWDGITADQLEADA